MFPKDFLWGISISGFQFEMGDPKRKNVDSNTDWFKWVHDPVNISRKVVSGDLPEDGVNYWELYGGDHDLAEGLGMNSFRIGMEWSRIFPRDTSEVSVGIETASDGGISRVELKQTDLEKLESLADMEALKHYEMIIDDLREKGFKVIVCLNHFTLPLWIHDPLVARDSGLRRGPRGWYDSSTIIEFTKYAAFVAWKLGHKVDMWAPFNEPAVVAEMGYFMGIEGFPPAVQNINAFKRVLLNMSTAHARAFDVIKEFDTQHADPDPQPASVGIIHNFVAITARDPSNEVDLQACNLIDNVHNNFFIEGATSGWVDLNLNGTRDRDEVRGYLGNRMDWLGVNYYTRMMIEGRKSTLARAFAGIPAIPKIVEGYGFGCKRGGYSNDGRPASDYGWELYPEGLSQVLAKISKYGKPIYVTENGIADSEDKLRPRYIVEHLRVLENLLEEKRIDVRGYLHWSLTDNYEWAEGFNMHFGLFSVDLTTKRRIPRKSAEVFSKIIRNGTTSGI
ncbi:MAG: beta-galactosidase BgaS [Thermoproteota archaeon]